MSENRPSKRETQPDESDSRNLTERKGKHGETENLATRLKQTEKKNREKFKEFQERYKVLKGNLPKSSQHEETSSEVTSTVKVEELQSSSLQIQSSSSTVISSDETGGVAKILRERDECSQKTKAALEMLEEKKHQFKEYKNLIAKVQKEYRKSDASKSNVKKGATEQPLDPEKETLQKDIEAKSKVIRALQLKNDKLTQAYNETKALIDSSVDTSALDNSNLQSELDLRSDKIKQLEEINRALTDDKLALEEKLTSKEKEFDRMHSILEICVNKVGTIGVALQLFDSNEQFEMEQLESKISHIQIEIIRIQKAVGDLDAKVAKESAGPSPKDSPQRIAKQAKNQPKGRGVKPKSPWASVTSSSQDSPKKDNKTVKSEEEASQVAALENLVSDLNKKITEYESNISDKDQEIMNIKESLSAREEEVAEILTKLNYIKNQAEDSEVASPESEPEKVNIELLELKLEESQKQIDDISKQLDDANKNMIKTKAAHKTKVKQMQKTIDSFSKMSDANSEVIKLNNEVASLIQKVAELEEDKGNLQLHLVDYDSVKEPGEGQSAKDLQQIAEARLQAISELEMQKFDLVQELHAANQKMIKLEEKVEELSQLENDHVSSQMNSVQLEEQLDKFNMECKSLSNQLDEFKIQNTELNDSIKTLTLAKADVDRKLESYIQENMELTEKLEKLSTEKVSSAESIEIVESLTTQEKLEIERFNEGISHSATSAPIPSNDYLSPELNEDILKLSQDSVELHNKIELFTQERREVMEKMDMLRNENLALIKNIEEYVSVKLQLESELRALKSESVALKDMIANLDSENKNIKTETEIVQRDKSNLELQLADLVSELSKERSNKIVVEEKKLFMDAELQVDIIDPETYETNAKTVKKLTKEILKLKTALKDKNMDADNSLQLEKQLITVNDEIQLIKTENFSLKDEKDALNQQIVSLTESNNKLSSEYQYLIAEKDLKDVSINDLNVSVSRLQNEIEHLNTLLNAEKLNSTQKIAEITDLQNKIVSLDENIHHKERIANELQNNLHSLEESKQVVCDKLKRCEQELMSMNCALDENENEINNLIKERDFNLKEINKLQNECKVKDDALKEISLKYSMQSNELENLKDNLPNTAEVTAAIESQLNALQEKYNKVLEKHSGLEQQNKEYLDKLRKFASNLKKKQTMCSDLESKIQVLNDQLEKQHIANSELNDEVTALKEKHSTIDEVAYEASKNVALQEENLKLQRSLSDFDNELRELRRDNETLQTQINIEQTTIEKLKTENELLINEKHEYESSVELTEKIAVLENDLATKKSEIEKLMESIAEVQSSYNNFRFGHEAKLQERDLFIETLETEIVQYKDRIGKLEECISTMEERRYSVERKAHQLGYELQQLQEQQKSIAELAQHEDELERRMAALTAHDEIIEKQLEETRVENQDLMYTINSMTKANQQQATELRNFQIMAEKQRQEMGNISLLEEEKQKLITELEKTVADHKKISADYEKKMKEQKEDFSNLESDMHAALENLSLEKKNLFEEYEKNLESISMLKYQIDEEQQRSSWLKSEHDLLLSSYSEAKSFKESSDRYELKYKDACNEIARLQVTLEEKDSLLNKPVQIESDKKISLSDYFSAPTEASFDILDQIVSPQEIKESAEKLPNIDICSSKGKVNTAGCLPQLSSPQGSEEKKEVKEEVIIPKAGYRCQQPVDDLEMKDDFESNWGEDAQLEEEHYHVQSLAIQSSDDYKKLNQQVFNLHNENEALSYELSEIKAKLSKTLKKMKELKSSNETLEIKLKSVKNNKSNDLDLAIQDELSSQVQKLEENLTALQTQLDKTISEKESFEKRVDVLSTANERLIEMKEQMDCESAMLKQRHKEFSNKLSQFESFAEVKSFSNESVQSSRMQENKPEVEELKASVRDLTADNEELQDMLEEMRRGKSELEKQVARQVTHSVSESDDIKVLKTQNQHLTNDVAVLKNKTIDLERLIHESDSAHSILKKQFQNTEAGRMAAEAAVAESYSKIDSLNHLNADLSARLETVTSQNMHLIEGVQKIENENRSLFDKLSALQTDYEKLMNDKENIHSDEVSKAVHDKQLIHSELTILNEQHQHLLKSYNELHQQVSHLSQSKSEIEMALHNEKEELLIKISNSTEEIAELSNQVTYLKEKSDKLSDKCTFYENDRENLVQSHNDAVLMNDKMNKSNLSLQEQYNRVESELGIARIRIHELQQREATINSGLNQESEAAERLREYEMLLSDKEDKLKMAVIQLDDLNTNLSSKERELEAWQSQYSLLEKQLSDVTFEKDAEIAKMRLDAYDAKIHSDAEYDKLRKEKDNIEIVLSKKIEEMRVVLESQEIDIVTLKETLAAMQTYAPAAQTQEVKEQSEARIVPRSDAHVPKNAELDFVSYLLHQRTVRCDELTMELSSLLEERDTLQLRLSDALRLNESLRSRCSPSANDSQLPNIGDTVTSAPASTSNIDSSPSDELKNKLTELKSVRHQKDIRVLEDQEQRQRELELMQMDVANLPEEAATRLRDAHYTLNRNTQSTSEVFLNWLMGKSTPKAVHNM